MTTLGTASLKEQAAAYREAKGTKFDRMSALVAKAVARMSSLDERFVETRERIVAEVNALDKVYRKTKDKAKRKEIEAKAEAIAAPLSAINRRRNHHKDRTELLNESFCYDRRKEQSKPKAKRAARNFVILKETLATHNVPVPSMTRVQWITSPDDVALDPMHDLMVRTGRNRVFFHLTTESARVMMAPLRRAEAKRIRAERKTSVAI